MHTRVCIHCTHASVVSLMWHNTFVHFSFSERSTQIDCIHSFKYSCMYVWIYCGWLVLRASLFLHAIHTSFCCLSFFRFLRFVLCIHTVLIITIIMMWVYMMILAMMMSMSIQLYIYNSISTEWQYMQWLWARICDTIWKTKCTHSTIVLCLFFIFHNNCKV